MHGQVLLALPRRAVPYGNRELDAPRIARAGRRDQTQRQARRPRANGLEQLGEEGAAKHRDLGIRVALQRVDRERQARSEEHTSELQSLRHLVCRLLLEKKKKKNKNKKNEHTQNANTPMCLTIHYTEMD